MRKIKGGLTQFIHLRARCAGIKEEQKSHARRERGRKKGRASSSGRQPVDLTRRLTDVRQRVTLSARRDARRVSVCISLWEVYRCVAPITDDRLHARDGKAFIREVETGRKGRDTRARAFSSVGA